MCVEKLQGKVFRQCGSEPRIVARKIESREQRDANGGERKMALLDRTWFMVTRRSFTSNAPPPPFDKVFSLLPLA